MTDVPTRNQIKKGTKVAIELKEDQGTGKLTEGIVKTLLTSSNFHPHGIKVELEEGFVGRVKKLFTNTDDVIILKEKQNKLEKKLYKLQNKISKLNDQKSKDDFDMIKNADLLVAPMEYDKIIHELEEVQEQLQKIYNEKLPSHKISKTDISTHKSLNETSFSPNKTSKIDTSIPRNEDEYNEFKSTFQYDFTEENLRRSRKTEAADARKNNLKKIREEIQKEVSLTIAAFANHDGGRLFIGVNDDSSILGLGRDLKQYGNSVDKLQLAIKDSLKKFLQNNAFIAKLKFEFVDSNDKQYLVIRIPPATEAIFVNTSLGQELYVRMQNSSEKFSYEDFMKHCKDRFQN